MQTLFDEIVQLQQAGKSAALATVVSRTGSVPMSKWAKMLVRRDGSMSGTVGGGCLEAEIWEDARGALAGGEASERVNEALIRKRLCEVVASR